MARLADQLQLGRARRAVEQLRRRHRVDRRDAATRRARPTRAARAVRSPAEGADLEHRARADRVEAGDDELGDVGERVAPLAAGFNCVLRSLPLVASAGCGPGAQAIGSRIAMAAGQADAPPADARDRGAPPRAAGRPCSRTPAMTARQPRRAPRVPLARRRRPAGAAADVGQRRLPGPDALSRSRRAFRRCGVPVLPRIAHRLAMAIAQVSIGDPVIVHPGVYIVHGQVVIDGLVEVHPGAVIAPWVTLGLRGGRRRRADDRARASASAPAPR